MKKKVIALTIDTHLTNDQLEESSIQLVCRDTAGEDEGLAHVARNIRVLDSDALTPPRSPADLAAIKEGLGLLSSMVHAGEEFSPSSTLALAAAREALKRLGI